MAACCWFLIFLAIFCVLAYQRAALVIWTICFTLLLVFITSFHSLTTFVLICWLVFLAIFIPLNLKPFRRRFISQGLLNFYREVMPVMSRTEREAISAGTVTWEGDLFRGNPNWDKLLSHAKATLTEEEQAFLDGPVETLCTMLNDW